jgi:nucleoside 2-deoxyribosyltransferase
MVAVFCSYSGKDASWIKSYRDLLTTAGHSTYLFQDDQQPGRYIAEKIQGEIDKADVVLAFITLHSTGSDYVQQEIGYALKAGKPIIPLVEDGVTSLGMLEGREYLPFHRNEDPEQMTPEGCNALLRYLYQLNVETLLKDALIGILLLAICIGVVYYVARHGSS